MSALAPACSRPTGCSAGNLFIDAQDQLYIVDWDAPILAPGERDLMDAGGGQMDNWLSPQAEERLFLNGGSPGHVQAVRIPARSMCVWVDCARRLWTADRRMRVQIYHKSAASGDGPAWICGHWNGSPLAIGTGLRTEVGAGEVRHHHPYCEYYVVLEGAAELEVEGRLVPLRAGMVVMVEPGEWHRVAAVGEQGARWVVIKERSEPDTKLVR